MDFFLKNIPMMDDVTFTYALLLSVFVDIFPLNWILFLKNVSDVSF